MIWPPERLTQARELRDSLGVAEAARRLGVGINALRMALRDHAADPLVAAQAPASAAPQRAVEPPGEAPAWVGYRPREGWAPERETRRAERRSDEVTTTVVIADLHVPYQDRLAVACATGIIRELAPDRAIIDGDFLDLESLSRHPKSRPDLARLSEEFYAGNVALDSLQGAAPSAEWVILEGNHESRAARYACEYGTLDGLLDVAAGLYLKPRSGYERERSNLRGARWVPLKLQPLTLSGYAYAHAVCEGKYHAIQHAEILSPRVGVPTVTAHMHGWQSGLGAAGGESYSCPWLGDQSTHVFGYTKGRPRPWSHGLLVVRESGRSSSVEHVRIQNGRAIVGGAVLLAA